MDDHGAHSLPRPSSQLTAQADFWPPKAARSRRSTAEALITFALALTRLRLAFPDPAVLRQALLS